MSGRSNTSQSVWVSATTALASIAALTTALTAATTVRAEDARIKEIGLSIVPQAGASINVTSSDGARWDTITPEGVSVRLSGKVITRGRGYVERAGIYLGPCSYNACGRNPRLAYKVVMVRDWVFAQDFEFDTRLIPVSTGGGIATVSYGDAILSRCNSELQSNGATGFHDFDQTFHVTLSANTRKGNPNKEKPEGTWFDTNAAFDGGDANTTTSFQLRVNCHPFVAITAPPKPSKIRFNIVQKGNTCPKQTDVTAIVTYHQRATANFRFNRNGKLSKWFSVPAATSKKNLSQKTRVATKTKTYHLDPGYHDFSIEFRDGHKSRVTRIKVTCPPFKVTSAWLDYKVADKIACPKRVSEEAKFGSTRPGYAPYRIKTQTGTVVASGTAFFQRKGRKYVAVLRRPKPHDGRLRLGYDGRDHEPV